MKEEIKQYWIESVRGMCQTFFKILPNHIGKCREKHQYTETEKGFDLKITFYGNTVENDPTECYSITRKYIIESLAPRGSKRRVHYFCTDIHQALEQMKKTYLYAEGGYREHS